jgi:hypothetical protein
MAFKLPTAVGKRKAVAKLGRNHRYGCRTGGTQPKTVYDTTEYECCRDRCGNAHPWAILADGKKGFRFFAGFQRGKLLAEVCYLLLQLGNFALQLRRGE